MLPLLVIRCSQFPLFGNGTDWYTEQRMERHQKLIKHLWQISYNILSFINIGFQVIRYCTCYSVRLHVYIISISSSSTYFTLINSLDRRSKLEKNCNKSAEMELFKLSLKGHRKLIFIDESIFIGLACHEIQLYIWCLLFRCWLKCFRKTPQLIFLRTIFF